MMLRLSFFFLLLALVVILPWWAIVLILLICCFLFPWYYEVVALALVYDILYGAGTFWLVITFLLIVPVIEELKKRLYVFN